MLAEAYLCISDSRTSSQQYYQMETFHKEISIPFPLQEARKSIYGVREEYKRLGNNITQVMETGFQEIYRGKSLFLQMSTGTKNSNFNIT